MALLLAIGAIGLQQMARLSDEIRIVNDVAGGKLYALNRVRFAIGTRAIAARNLALVSDAQLQKKDLGRGFAVVASEVRSLAQRSAAAAREIKDLIGDSVGRVDEGSALVDQAGRTMQQIVASVQRVAEIIGEITVASREQTDGIEQVNQAIAQIDQVTQQNAALVQQAGAAAGALQAQAGSLSQAVSVFRL